jgi:hypothetical protein
MSKLEMIAWWLVLPACVFMVLFPPWYRKCGPEAAGAVAVRYDWLFWDQSAVEGREPYHLHMGQLLLQCAGAVLVPLTVRALASLIDRRSRRRAAWKQRATQAGG